MSNKPTGVAGLTLTPAKESILKELKDGKLNGREIAKKYNVCESYVSRIKPKGIKIVKPKTVTQKKHSPIKKTKMEEESIEMAKAKKAKEAFNKIETQRKAEGWKWESVTSEYGKKSMIFRKPIN